MTPSAPPATPMTPVPPGPLPPPVPRSEWPNQPLDVPDAPDDEQERSHQGLAHPGRGPLSRDPAEAAARIVTAGLFLGLTYRIGLDALDTGRLTGVLLLASESLVVILTLARRQASVVDRRWWVRLVAVISMAGPFLLRPAAGLWDVEAYTVSLSAAGLFIVVAGKISLGRSFGLLPAHRGLTSTGLYRLVRHPIYLGYLLTHGAFLAANPSAWNLVALGTADAALLVRAVLEEETLRRDPAYARYRARVPWRVVPGVY